jgi:hypothetical protein
VIDTEGVHNDNNFPRVRVGVLVQISNLLCWSIWLVASEEGEEITTCSRQIH